MRIAVYGGSFNPPHLGHVNVADAVLRGMEPDVFYIIPAGIPPHKELAAGSATNAQRMDMARLAFGEGVCVSDIEMRRKGKSYTSDTMRQLMSMHPGAGFVLVMGTDMFLSLDTWHEADFLLGSGDIEIAVVPRDSETQAIFEKSLEYRQKFGTRTHVLSVEPVEAASSDLRELLGQREGRNLLPDSVYAYIIRNRIYGAQPDWDWLREQAYAMLKPKRIPHVAGCEMEARRLARRWDADEDAAAEAGILHDITKRLGLNEQLILCEKYGIIPDTLEAKSEKLLHSKTGAALAADVFGVSGQVESAIRWHTTGRPGMTLLEKIIYLADYIEPTRDFEGVDALRELAYSDLDAALVLGFEMSLEDLAHYGAPPHKNTLDALEWYRKDGKI